MMSLYNDATSVLMSLISLMEIIVQSHDLENTVFWKEPPQTGLLWVVRLRTLEPDLIPKRVAILSQSLKLSRTDCWNAHHDLQRNFTSTSEQMKEDLSLNSSNIKCCQY